MDTVNLVSLVVEYEVPSTKIIDAIAQGNLRPIVRCNPPLSLDDIEFTCSQVESLFWSYELKRKSAAEKAELTRRLNRYEAIVTGIISSVVASGVIAVASELFGPGGSERPRLRPISKPPLFLPPIEEPDSFLLSKAAGDLRIEARSPLASRFRLIAAASGIVVELASTPHDFMAPRVCIDHGRGWWSFYSADAGRGNILVRRGQRVRRGRPVLEILGTRAEGAEAGFSIWHAAKENPPDDWVSHLSLVNWPWQTNCL